LESIVTTETDNDIVYTEREPGIYPAVFTAIKNHEYNDQATGELEKRWVWEFADEAGTMDTMTSRLFAARSKATKIFTGIVGRAPKNGDKPSAFIGKDVNVVWGPNQNGRLTITDVVPLKAK
jgi:hypothetical protein